MLRLLFALLSALPLTALAAQELSYSRDIQPIFTRNCVACHACYDAPCQLNLGSAEGVLRGASKATVYDGGRRQAQATTRLYFDAQGEAAWRRKDFFSVLEPQDGQAALLKRMLELGRQQPLTANQKLPDELDLSLNRQNQCPKPQEFDTFAKTSAHAGMPFATTGLSEEDYHTLNQWLDQGAPIDASQIQPTASEQAQIAQWEAFLNNRTPRQELVNRWLFEHLFLAHLYFEGEHSGHFFQLVRSRTPSGQPIQPIATRRPNEDPGSTFYYRLWPIEGAIVYKTHITYPLSARKLKRTQELFYSENWPLDELPGYGAGRRANPFATFAAIPAKARYQFMLDNAEYFVRTFIRGPVCRGQIATDVIRDNFWALFQAPERDLYITDPQYRAQATALLAMPGQFDQLSDLPGLWRTYKNKRNDYEELRQEAYEDQPAPSWSQIWLGNDNALLSIFRHHDSAVVRKGLLGEIPQTLWLLDYPLLERTYYQLVVNFDVFGNVSHQAQTRLYFDLIRNGAELNFLRLMPAQARRSYLDDWYQNSGKLKMWLDYASADLSTPTGLSLPKDDPKKAFAEKLIQRAGTLISADPINRCNGAQCARAGIVPELARAEQSLSRLPRRPASGLKVINFLPESTLLRVEYGQGQRELYSLLRNKAHSNVAFMLGEDLRQQPGLDTLTVLPGILTSYPNFIFNLKAEQVPDFVRALEQIKTSQEFEALTERLGIRRTHPQFWFYVNDLTRYMQERQPIEAGVFDINRYQNL